MTRMVRINRDRLWACLMELKQIGAYDDEATGLQGVRRLALTDADAQARRRCVDWMLQAGLDVRVDRIGNVYATRPGRDRALPSVRGEAAHAGTTPIGSRHDAGLVAASVVVEARRMCDSDAFGQLRATVGNFDLGKGQTNVIPRRATLTVDLRNPDDDRMTAVAGENGRISHTPREYSNPTACGNGIDVLANAVLRLADRP